jgi:hypothetical protein
MSVSAVGEPLLLENRQLKSLMGYGLLSLINTDVPKAYLYVIIM